MASTPPQSAATDTKLTLRASETLLGMIQSLEQRFGMTPLLDAGTTLNTKYGVFPARNPVNPRYQKYFSIGIGGKINDSATLSSAQLVRGTDMGLYTPRPFRAVQLESDLTPTERAKYALREVRLINGQLYCLYWLKRVEFSLNQVQLLRTDPATGTTTSYEIDHDNLSPVPPLRDSNGIIQEVEDQISVVVPGLVSVTGAEMLEVNGVLDNGDPRMAEITEFGLVSASTESVSVKDSNDVSFSYNEAIFAQLCDHVTFTGYPLHTTRDVWKRTMMFSNRNIISQS